MIVFNIISLLGGLALFLYGMRIMSSNLKEGSSGTLKVAMEKVTNNPFKAFFLGVAVTAIIQSSTATIVITSGLVAAGVLSLHQSLGIIMGANVGTTVTGQIIRLLDISGDSNPVLQFFKPSTLAPIALIIGIILIMFCKFKKSDNIGSIAMGFGILFTGLMGMTEAVSSFTENGVIEKLFMSLGDRPLLGYLAGAGVAFVLQSSSATIGILQAFSLAGGIPFKTIYVVLVGIYLGDCVTTAIVCSIGARAEAKRVGIVNILFNLSETVLVLVAVTLLHSFGFLGDLWDMTMTSGSIANTNTVFNLGCAILLFPMAGVYEKLAHKFVRDDEEKPSRYADKIEALSPVFFSTPALAFRGCYSALITMLDASVANIGKAVGLLTKYDDKALAEIYEEEDNVDLLADKLDGYLLLVSSHVSEDLHIRILNQYHKMVNEFEHLGDRAVNLAENAVQLHSEDIVFTEEALEELNVVKELMDEMIMYTRQAFVKRDVAAARHIEPLEEVMNDLTNSLHDNHLMRLRDGKCTVKAGVIFMEVLSVFERISDTCSNIGVAVITRANPETADLAHTYVSSLHQGNDTTFNEEYDAAHEKYFKQLDV